MHPTDPEAYEWPEGAFEKNRIAVRRPEAYDDSYLRTSGFVSDDDLPGQWSHSDFEGGDPDERSYAQRERDGETGWRQRFIAGIDTNVDPEFFKFYEPGIQLCDRQIPTEGQE